MNDVVPFLDSSGELSLITGKGGSMKMKMKGVRQFLAAEAIGGRVFQSPWYYYMKTYLERRLITGKMYCFKLGDAYMHRDSPADIKPWPVIAHCNQRKLDLKNARMNSPRRYYWPDASCDESTIGSVASRCTPISILLKRLRSLLQMHSSDGSLQEVERIIVNNQNI
jgi:hypothetical protein